MLNSNSHYYFFFINETGEKIMNTLQDYAESQKAYSDSMNRLIENIRKDVQRLKDQVAKLQSSTGLNDQDKAMLDKMQLSQESLVQQLTEIDNLSAPEVPATDVQGNLNAAQAQPAANDQGQNSQANEAKPQDASNIAPSDNSNIAQSNSPSDAQAQANQGQNQNQNGQASQDK